MDGPAYIHFSLPNMITIWLMVLVMGAVSAKLATAYKNRAGGAG